MARCSDFRDACEQEQTSSKSHRRRMKDDRYLSAGRRNAERDPSMRMLLWHNITCSTCQISTIKRAASPKLTSQCLCFFRAKKIEVNIAFRLSRRCSQPVSDRGSSITLDSTTSRRDRSASVSCLAQLSRHWVDE